MSWLNPRLPVALLAFAVGCDLFNSDPDIPAECKGTDDEIIARFDIDLGELTPEALAANPGCTIAALGSALELDCLDGDGVARRARIGLTAEPAIELPAKVGDKVDFALHRDATGAAQLGIWTVRTEAGDLLVAGNQANATVPGDPEFFVPLKLSVDDTTCPELADEESCYFTQHLLVTVDDGLREVTLTQGETADLDSRYRVQIERATQYRPGDGKACQVDETLPAPYRFLIVRLP